MDALAVVVALAAAADDPPDLNWLGPVAAAVGSTIVGIVGAAALITRRKQDRQESLQDKAIELLPTEKDGWAEVRAARDEASRYYRLYRLFEDLFYSAHAALRMLARLFHERNPDAPIPDEVVKALALRAPEELDKV